MPRGKTIIGNWKMHKGVAEAGAFVDVYLQQGVQASVPPAEARSTAEVTVGLAPPFVSLAALGERLKATGIRLCAQNVHWEASGAFTGEVSPPMLREIGCDFCLVGHSERRQLFGETDEEVRRKVSALSAADIRPVICVGETLEQRDAGQTLEIVRSQVEAALAAAEQGALHDPCLAYEPVWAIGTGRTATPAQAQEVHAEVRQAVANRLGGAFATRIPILYGGSVKPDNATELLGQPDIDGALVGGASLDAPSFAAIVAAAKRTRAA